MNSKSLLTGLLTLNDNITSLVDLENQKVLELYNKNEKIASDITLEEFSKTIADVYNLENSFSKKLLRFFDSLDTSSDIFELPVDYVAKDGSPVSLIYKGYMYDVEKKLVLITITYLGKAESTQVDELTKTFNKAFIISKVKEAIEQKREFALLLLSIDNFDSFNDAYGHMFGDIVLIEAVASIKKTIANKGYISRIGGAEFLILVYVENNYDLIHGVCRDIRTSTNDLSIHNIKQIEITTTVGCSSYPKDGETFNILFKKADRALLRGKKKGRDCFIIYTEERCGKVLDDDIESTPELVDKIYNANTNYNIITGVLELMNRDEEFKKNMDDSLSIIGNYFVLDRITVAALRPEDDKIDEMYVWYSPGSNKIEPMLYNDNIEKWRSCMDQIGMIRINQVESNKDLAIYDELHQNHTTALLSFEMKVNEVFFGNIKFEMTTVNRSWQQNDISALMLISKIFAIKLKKEFDMRVHYKELYYDRVTDIYNYNKWRNDIFNILERNPFASYSILEFNIENYRGLKSIIGPNACKQILVTIANQLKKSKPGVLFCRDADDKFLMYFPHHDEEEINLAFYDIVRAVKDNNPIKNTNVILHGGAYLAHEGEEFSDAYDKAILARRNQNLPDQIAYFSQKLYDEVQFKTQIELHMRQALESGEFLLYLQPKINSKTNKVVGAEALTRWNYNFKKLIFPNVFIPIFEETGFIEELDYVVFENVCKFQRKTMDEGKSPIPISVNVSRYIVDFTKYLNKLNSIRDKYKIPKWLIEIEITEGMYIDNVEIIDKFITMLHEAGYTVSMDDFGSGYSNLSSLSTLNFDTIKLDKSFCKNQNGKEAIILSSTISMIKNLNMNILCEGVETKEYTNYLKTLGCFIIQGYYFDKPLPEEEFRAKYIK